MVSPKFLISRRWEQLPYECIFHVQNRQSRVQTPSLDKSSVCQDAQNLCFPALILAAMS